MGVAVNNFADLPMKNKLVILGDMLELGEDSEKEHQQLIDLLKERSLENVYLVGDIFSKVNSENKFKTFLKADEVAAILEKEDVKNHYILIKGSRGIQLEKLVEKL
jgi:UDP-N-acetylmuramoyl-tripeptide--D-alanyl-D-alanine ligase